MAENSNDQSSPTKNILGELLSQTTDPVHKRIISAYAGEDPVVSMEGELAKILLEIMKDENK